MNGQNFGVGMTSLKKDDGSFQTRSWNLFNKGDGQYLISSNKNMVIDDWGGRIGKMSVSLMPDDNSVQNRLWSFVPALKLKLVLSNFKYPQNV